jgi:hypothetical protein
MRRSRPDLAARNRASANPDLPYRKWPSEHAIWRGMIARCHRSSAKDFGRYGARGVTVCEQWRGKDGFSVFFSDMGPRPSTAHSIERTHNDGPYDPSNCVWTTPTAQARNRRNNRTIEHGGTVATLAEWSERTGISRVLIAHRIKAGWSTSEALTVKPDRSANSRRKRTKEECSP